MSLRLALTNAVLRLAARPRLRRIRDIRQARREFAFFCRLFLRSPAGVAVDETPGTPPMLRFTPPGAGPSPVILYLHGGGFTVGSPRTHRAVIGRLARAAGMVAVGPVYRLAPEHRFPAAQEDARAAWDALVRQGLPPERIALAGDSAGGGLAFGLLAELCAQGTPPFAVVGFSPWVDLTGSGESPRANAATDRLLPAGRFGELAGHALGDHPPEDPRASPLFADFPGAPPVQLWAARGEILLDDSRRLADHLRRQGATVDLRLVPEVPHAWPVMAGLLPEADAAVEDAAAFLRRHAPAAAP